MDRKSCRPFTSSSPSSFTHPDTSLSQNIGKRLEAKPTARTGLLFDHRLEREPTLGIRTHGRDKRDDTQETQSETHAWDRKGGHSVRLNGRPENRALALTGYESQDVDVKTESGRRFCRESRRTRRGCCVSDTGCSPSSAPRFLIWERVHSHQLHVRSQVFPSKSTQKTLESGVGTSSSSWRVKNFCFYCVYISYKRIPAGDD